MRVSFRHGYVVTYPTANHIDEWMEHTQNPNNTKDIEQHVGKGRTACLCVGCHGYDI